MVIVSASKLRSSLGQRAGLDVLLQQLRSKERVAFAHAEDRVGELRRCIGRFARTRDKGLDIGGAQTRQRERGRAMLALQVAARVAQRMRRVDAVVAIEREDEDRHAADAAREKRERIDRIGLRPMQIFEHDQERTRARDAFKRARKRFVQTRAGRARFDRFGGGESGPHAKHFGHERGEHREPQRIDRRFGEIRQAAAHRVDQRLIGRAFWRGGEADQRAPALAFDDRREFGSEA